MEIRPIEGTDPNDIEIEFSGYMMDEELEEQELETFQNLLGIATVCLDCLYDLTPSLEYPAVDFIAQEEIAALSSGDMSSIVEPARPFAQNIMDRYPDIDKTLVRRLAEANWDRRTRLLAKIDSAAAVYQQTEQHQGIGITSQMEARQINRIPLTVTDSTTNTSLFDSALASVKFGDTNSVSSLTTSRATGTSFATSVGDGASSIKRSLPPLPLDYDFDSAFQCSVCGDIITITDRAKWK